MNSTIQLITALVTLAIVVINHYQGKTVHKLVNNTSENQVQRIEDLTEKLVNGEVKPPTKE
jgi:hypothetical protein